jgi:hypothetical protein
MRALIAGWFSFEGMGATAGDLLARDVACEWVRQAGHDYEIAHSPSFAGGIDWATADPTSYPLVLFVCGPLGNGEPATSFLERFKGSRVVGLNLSMLQPLTEWDPFDLLLERDSSRTARADITFGSKQALVPVIGVVLVHAQQEYKDPLHEVAHAAIERLTSSRPMAVIPIDTCLDPPNNTGLRTPAEIESVIARMDAVITTRLHGLVLALKNSVPVVGIDPIAGGAKIRRQGDTIGWPLVFNADQLSDDELRAALDGCLAPDARARAATCAADAAVAVGAIGAELVSYLEES